MPRIFLFEPTKLLLRFFKLKIVKIVKRFRGFQLNNRAVDENDGGVFLWLCVAD